MENLVEQLEEVKITEVKITEEIKSDSNCYNDMIKEQIKEAEQKKVSFNPILTEPPKNDSPKIDLSFKVAYVVLDKFTDSIVGVYSSNKKATTNIIKLIKTDLEAVIIDNRKKLLTGESVEENQISLQNIRQSLYHYKTIEQTGMMHILLNNESKFRYRIIVSKFNEDVDDESGFNSF